LNIFFDKKEIFFSVWLKKNIFLLFKKQLFIMTTFKLNNWLNLEKTFENPFDLMNFLFDNFDVEVSEIEGQDDFVKSDFYKDYSKVLNKINLWKS